MKIQKKIVETFEEAARIVGIDTKAVKVRFGFRADFPDVKIYSFVVSDSEGTEHTVIVDKDKQRSWRACIKDGNKEYFWLRGTNTLQTI